MRTVKRCINKILQFLTGVPATQESCIMAVKEQSIRCVISTSTKEGGYVFVVVCLFVSNFSKNFRTDLHEIFRKVGNRPMNRWLNFGGDPDHRLDIEIVFRIRQYWETRKVVNGRKSAAHTDSPDGGTGNTCLGGCMHCPNASSYYLGCLFWFNQIWIFRRCFHESFCNKHRLNWFFWACHATTVRTYTHCSILLWRSEQLWTTSIWHN